MSKFKTKRSSRNFLLKALRKALSRFYFSVTDVIEVNDLRQYIPSDTGSDGSLLIRVLMPTDLAMVDTTLGRAVGARFRERMASSTGYMALAGDTIAGWVWVTRDKRPREGVAPFFYPIVPPENSAYIYDVHTVPAARNQGVMKALFRYMVDQERQAGAHCLFFTHDRTNAAMRQLAKTYGFTAAGKLTCRRCLWRERRDIADLEKICVLS